MSRDDPRGPGRKRDEDTHPSPSGGGKHGGSTGGADEDPTDPNANRTPKK